MSRRYRKSRRDPGLFEIATTSDCKVSAAMAAVCVLAATVIIPAMFGSSRMLSGLVLAFVPLAWLMAVLFGSISLIRFLQRRPRPIRPRGRANSMNNYASGETPQEDVNLSFEGR